MTAFFDDLDRLKSRQGDERKNERSRWSEWRETGLYQQRERIERPSRRVIVVGILKFLTVAVSARYRNTIEMRVDRSGVIVIGARLRSGMDVLERG